jgi:hypothetical protein
MTFAVTPREAFSAMVAATRPTTDGGDVEKCLVSFKTGRELPNGQYIWLFWTARCRPSPNGGVNVSVLVKADADASRRRIAAQKAEDLRAFWSRLGSALKQ